MEGFLFSFIADATVLHGFEISETKCGCHGKKLLIPSRMFRVKWYIHFRTLIRIIIRFFNLRNNKITGGNQNVEMHRFANMETIP